MTSATPSDMPARRPDGYGQVSEEHPLRINDFSFFRYRGEKDAVVPGPELAAMAWDQAVDSLAELAEDEDWGVSDTGRTRPILSSYIKYTYQRLVIEDKIMVSRDGAYAIFNTGLLNSYAEEIFGLFSANRSESENARRWFFNKWAVGSDRDILRHFDELPDMAEYVNSAADLVYDWRRDLKLSYDHIISDNKERFPAECSTSPFKARQALETAVSLAILRARRNYKTVVPNWYPARDDTSIQFLMPLDLTGDGKADLALVVQSIGDKYYRGNTVLTLDMAYSNARLVARPDSEWLKPSSVHSDNSEPA